MSKNDGSGGKDYEIGYKKPPKHSRWVPGQSGFKGHKKRPPETQAQIVARVRDELVTVNGKTMTKFELAVASALNQTIRSGKPRDLKLLFELLDKHGGIPQGDLAAQQAADSDYVMQKIGQIVERTFNIDPKDVALIDDLNAEEVSLVMSCNSCGPELRRRWADPEYTEVRKRHGATALHRQILNGETKRKLWSYRPGKLRSEK